MYLRLCTWGLLLLALGLFAHTFIVEADEAGTAPAPLRALHEPEDFALKSLATAVTEAKDAGGEATEAASEACDASGIPSSVLLAAAEKLRIVPVDGLISSEFGSRVLISFSRPRMHSGVDIKAKRGTPVKAAGAGTVVFAGRDGTYGVIVRIDHGGNLSTCYAHMDKSLVKAGDVVEAGQEIGVVGKTGKTTGVNLHLEVRINNKCIDPRLVFTWPPSPPRKPKPQLP